MAGSRVLHAFGGGAAGQMAGRGPAGDHDDDVEEDVVEAADAPPPLPFPFPPFCLAGGG